MPHIVKADQLQAQPPSGPQPRRGALEERAVDLDLLVGAQRLRGEVLGCLDTGDRVVWPVRLMVGPALQQIGHVGHVPAGREAGLAGAQGQPDPRGSAVRADKAVEERPPSAADVEHAPTAHPEAVREEVELAVLCPGERIAVVPGFPPAAGVHHVRAQPDPEEVVGQVVVVPDRARRGAHRGQPLGAGHGPLWTGGRPTPASRCAATSPTVRSWLRPRKTSIGSSIPARISMSVMISAAASESTPRPSSVDAGVTRSAGTPQTLTIDSRSATSRFMTQSPSMQSNNDSPVPGPVRTGARVRDAVCHSWARGAT